MQQLQNCEKQQMQRAEGGRRARAAMPTKKGLTPKQVARKLTKRWWGALRYLRKL